MVLYALKWKQNENETEKKNEAKQRKSIICTFYAQLGTIHLARDSHWTYIETLLYLFNKLKTKRKNKTIYILTSEQGKKSEKNNVQSSGKLMILDFYWTIQNEQNIKLRVFLSFSLTVICFSLFPSHHDRMLVVFIISVILFRRYFKFGCDAKYVHLK